MDYANERYVRLYTRDTTTVRLLGWQGRLVLWSLVRKLDRSGVLDCEGIEPWEAAALHGDMPEDVAREGMRRCLDRGCFVVNGSRLVAPNYIPANETPQSDKQRAKESRERRASLDTPPTVTNRDGAITERDQESRNATPASHSVTPRHAASRDVTPSLSVPIRAVPSLAEPSQSKPDCGVPPAAGPEPKRLTRRKPALVDPLGHQVATAAIWDAYRVAYFERYEVEPLRNAKVNGQIAQLAKRIPHTEAPAIVAAYLRSNNARYIATGHAIGPLLQDAEAVRTEAVTGKQRTQWAARDADKRDGRRQDYEELFLELRAIDEANARKAAE